MTFSKGEIPADIKGTEAGGLMDEENVLSLANRPR